MRQILLRTFPIALTLLPLWWGCGGNKGSRMLNVSPKGSGTLVIQVDWGNSRLIPVEAVRIDVTVTGEGLSSPRTASITRPNDSVIISGLPVGAKTVVGEAKDRDGRTVSRGSGSTVIREGERSSVDIVMEAVPVGGGTLTVTVIVGGVERNADFLAYQDGDGPWRVASGTGGVYNLTITDRNGRYGVAAYVGGGQAREVIIGHATLQELNNLRIVFPGQPTPPQQYQVSGSVSGLPATLRVVGFVALGPGSGNFSSSDPTYRLFVPAGLYDLWAHYGDGRSLNRGYLRRNVNVTGDTTLNIDFADGNYAFDRALMPIEVTNIPTGWSAYALHRFQTRNATDAPLGFLSSEGTTTLSGIFGSVPSERIQDGDVLELEVSALTHSPRYASIAHQRWFGRPDRQNVALPVPFTSPETSIVSSTPYVRTQTTWTPYPRAQAYLLSLHSMGGYLSASFGDRRSSRQPVHGTHWYVDITTGWLGTRSSYTLPDFSGLTGWNNEWGLSGSVTWEIEAVFANVPLQEWLKYISGSAGVNIRAGLEFTSAFTQGQVSP
ncbi:MAG: hypothetical protein NZ959_04895 [Armatimonadetes bacterium]|nr:hypothetical protein [Armatimonadota bacterium]MDW8120911.1 hypothetical protein [Armatimonadota bacterium]